MIKISFLMAAHNEEKIIGKALDNLSVLPYKNYEVLIGLDGCTDKTEEIVKKYFRKSKKFKYYKTNLRSGKPDVINFLMPHATGDIVIIHDADWIFKAGSKKSFEKFISVFKDSKVGGIAESFPIELDKQNLSKSNLGYRMVCFSTLYWYEFQKERFSMKESNHYNILKPSLFMTNVFRRSLYRKNSLLGDDFERTAHILNEGYKIVFFDDLSIPRMIASYTSIALHSLFKQKIRTALARKQLKSDSKDIGLFSYYFPSVLFILRKSFKKGFFSGMEMLLWVLITALATLISKFKNLDTKQGWLLRARK